MVQLRRVKHVVRWLERRSHIPQVPHWCHLQFPLCDPGAMNPSPPFPPITIHEFHYHFFVTSISTNKPLLSAASYLDFLDSETSCKRICCYFPYFVMCPPTKPYNVCNRRHPLLSFLPASTSRLHFHPLSHTRF